MKKLGKLKLRELEDSCLLMGAAEANNLKGGTTQEEFFAAVDAGSWGGGVVEGLGYCEGIATIYGSSFPPSISYDSTEPMSYQSYLNSQLIGDWAQGWDLIEGQIPIWQVAKDWYSNKMDAEYRELVAGLTSIGITGTDTVRVESRVDASLQLYMNVYDASGSLIYTTHNF